jgi:acyl transferase domain-containing protein/acyl carrier protein/NAD(P)-dependent dehydrogenase (short-subunit alcohol dehydrogenase family)
VEGRDAIQELPSDRIDKALHFSPQKGVRGKTYSSIGGLIPNRPLNLDLVPLAKTAYQDFDESHWIMAEVAASAWHNAIRKSDRRSGSILDKHLVAPSAPANRRVGVYIGHSGGSRRAGEVIYSSLARQTAELIDRLPQLQSKSAQEREAIKSELSSRMKRDKAIRTSGGKPFLDASSAARLVALNLDLDGPQMVIDAACASSLASLAMACLSLQSGDIDSAIVGGASYNKIDSLILFSQAQSCSATGSRPFDENADGLISSEGYIALVLKKLDKAEEDKDFIWGVIRGVGMSTDGRGKSLWAPRREGQLKAVQRAYSEQMDPRRVQYVEAHATSTQVGDATEVQALGDFFLPILGDKKIPIGSVKSNIGHTLETAGLAGVLKTILAMHHETIPPSIHFQTPSQSIPWDKIPFHIPTASTAWNLPTDGSPRCGAVNAFGIGGLNVHVVLEQGCNTPHDRRLEEPPRFQATSRSRSSRDSQQKVAIIGRGLIVPGANGLPAYLDLTKSNRSQLIDPPADRWKSRVGLSGQTATIATARGGYLTDYAYDWMKHRVPPKQVQNANPLQFMLLDAAGQALDEARLAGTKVDFERTSVVVGTIFGGEFGHQLQMGLRLMELRRDLELTLRNAGVQTAEIVALLDAFERSFLEWNPALLDETGSFTSSTLASRITKQYNLQGGALAIDTGACSSLSALYAAMNLLECGYSDTVICAAGNRAMDLPAFETLAAKGLLKNDASPYLPGEGVSVLLLKRLSDATSQQNKIYGVLNRMSIEKEYDRTVTRSHPVPSELQPLIGDLQAARGLTEIIHHLSTDSLSPSKTVQQMTDDFLMHSISVSNSVEDSEAEPKPIQEIASANSFLMELKASTAKHLSDRTTVALFPGQGSHQRGMVDHCLSVSANACMVLEQANSILQTLGSPRYEVVVQKAAEGTRESSWYSQASILIADMVHWAAIREKGFEPTSVVGHSLGEWAALIAAESWDLETALRFLRLRADAVDELRLSNRGLLSIPLGHARVESMLHAFANSLVVTHRNGPNQTVVGGPISQLEELESRLHGLSVTPMLLNVPAPFHTPEMASAAHRLAQHAKDLQLLPPKKVFFSTVSDSYESDPRRIVRSLIHQLTTPVDFCSAIETLYAHGGRRFVEVGPGKVLSRLCASILENQPVECIEFRDALEGIASGDVSFNRDKSASSRSSLSNLTSRSATLAAVSLAMEEPAIVDATQARRQRRKEQSQLHAPAVSDIRTPPSIDERPLQPVAHSTSLDNQTSEAKLPALETFIKDFIVEHTGYPKEMIQLDWELEADLGIDSIKLVQLMGELRELFDLDPQVVRNAGVKTLREILTLLEAAGGKREWLEDPVESPTQSQIEVTPATPVSTTQVTSPSVPRSQLETFMIDFVIEHTGYPRNMVDLSAELEADLGLDSIKLAQLMGELRSHFGFDLNTEVRKQLTKAKTLNEILSTLGVEEESAKTFDTPVSTETLDADNLHAASVVSDVSVKTLHEMAKLHAPRIHHQLIEDLRNWPADRYVGQDLLASDSATKVTNFAHAVGVPKENLSGLLHRHGTGEQWRELADYLEVVPTNDSFKEPISPVDKLPTITKRYLLRTERSASQPRSTKVEWLGAACVFGNNPVATELCKQLIDEGVETFTLDSTLSATEAVEKLEAFWNRHGTVPYLFLTNPHDDLAIGSLREYKRLDQRHDTIQTAFWVCQRWLTNHLKSGSIQNASLVALAKLGGDFGFQQVGLAPESGALSGLLKAILIESWVNGHRQLPIKVIDAGETSTPSSIVESAFMELANPSFDTEVAWANGVRHVVRAIPTPTRSARFRPSRGVWICTGGGRGITAFVAEQLAKRYGLELHLLGMAPAPNIAPQFRDLDEQGRKEFKNRVMLEATERGLNSVKAWQDMEKQLEIDATLRRMRANGISVYYHGCNVTDRKSLDLCLAHIREHHGPIRGCLHGAGVGQDSRFDRKRPDKVKQCLGAKIDGLVNLMQSTLQDPLECMIGFGSISGRFGANGHTDYSLANEALAKYIGWYRTQRPEVRSTAFHWHAWGDVGMATKPETKLALEMIEMQFMPAEEGLAHLTNEIEAGLPEAEVLVTDDRYFRMFYPSETIQSSDSAGAPSSASMAGSHIRPLLDRVDRTNGKDLYHGQLDPTRDVFLREHVYENNPLLPFVIAMECMAEAATASNALHDRDYFPMRFDDVSIQRPLRFERQETREFSVECGYKRSSNENAVSEVGQCALRFCAPFKNRSGVLLDAEREYSRANWSRTNVRPVLRWEKPTMAFSNVSMPTYPDASQPFYVGPAFRVLKQYALGDKRVTGRILAPSLIELVGSHRSTDGWVLPCAVIDACLFTSGILAWNTVRPGVCLPMTIQTMQLFDRPRAGESCTVESRLVRSDEQYVWFDFCVWGSDNRLLMEAMNYQAAWVGNVS